MTKQKTKAHMDLVSTETAVDIGRDLDEQIAGKYKIIRDKRLSSYTTELTRKLQAYYRKHKKFSDLVLSISILDTDQINIFSLVHGRIYITRAMVGLMDYENELMGMLCHEVAHFINRDQAKRVSEAGISMFGMNMLGILSWFNHEVPVMLDFDKDYSSLFRYGNRSEFEKDSKAIACLVELGYDSRGMLTILQKIGLRSKKVEAMQYLETHPRTTSRVDYTRRLLAFQVPQKNVIVNTPEFDYFKRRLLGDAAQ